MSAALRDFSLLWRAAMAKAPRHINAMVCGMGLFFALFVGALVQMKTGNPASALLNGMRAACGVLAFGWLTYFIAGAISLNTPVNAQLVPRMRRRLIQLTVLSWASTAGMGAVLALGTPIGAHLVFLVVGAWLIALGLTRSGHAAGQVSLLVFPFLFIFNTSIPRECLALLATVSGFSAASLLTMALGAFTLDVMYPHGGDRHYRLRAAQILMTDRMTNGGLVKNIRIPRLGLWMYAAALTRDCARRDARALLNHVLGPAAHWTQRLLPMALMAGIAVGFLALMHMVGSADIFRSLSVSFWVAMSTVLLIPLFDADRRLMRLSLTRGEQSLVRLAPSMPGTARAFNRCLATSFLLAGLGEWAIVSFAVLGVVALAGASFATLSMTACLCCLTLPLLASTLRDHASRSGTGAWWMLLWLLVSLALSFLAGAFVQRALGTPVLPTAALAAVALACAAVAWRWRTAVAAPHAFPVGRLA